MSERVTAIAVCPEDVRAHTPVAVPLLDPLSFALWATLSVLLIALGAAIIISGFRVVGVPVIAAYFVPFAIVSLLLRRRGWLGSAALLESLAQFMLAGLILGLLVLILASTNFPYRDPELAALDRLLFGFDWIAASRAMTDNPWIGMVLNRSYGTIAWQPFLLIFILAAAGQLQRLRIFLLAWVITLALTIAIFPFIPAVGAYVHYGVPQSDMPGVLVKVAWRHLEILQPLRDGVLRELNIGSFAGIVTFPSFHASAAVLLAWGFFAVPYLRWPALFLNVVMLVSSMPIGAHYVIDLVAGALIAAGVLFFLKRMAGRLGSSTDQDRKPGEWLKQATAS